MTFAGQSPPLRSRLQVATRFDADLHLQSVSDAYTNTPQLVVELWNGHPQQTRKGEVFRRSGMVKRQKCDSAARSCFNPASA